MTGSSSVSATLPTPSAHTAEVAVKTEAPKQPSCYNILVDLEFPTIDGGRILKPQYAEDPQEYEETLYSNPGKRYLAIDPEPPFTKRFVDHISMGNLLDRSSKDPAYREAQKAKLGPIENPPCWQEDKTENSDPSVEKEYLVLDLKDPQGPPRTFRVSDEEKEKSHFFSESETRYVAFDLRLYRPEYVNSCALDQSCEKDAAPASQKLSNASMVSRGRA